MTVLQYTQLSLMAKASLGPWDTLPRWVCSSARAGHTEVAWPSAVRSR